MWIQARYTAFPVNSETIPAFYNSNFIQIRGDISIRQKNSDLPRSGSANLFVIGNAAVPVLLSDFHLFESDRTV